ncbi:MAG: hypothetical protein GVY29_13270, partial [Spirochaetes bacterium]|nr:hypothetical protein [Spirochaetota bacterium]
TKELQVLTAVAEEAAGLTRDGAIHAAVIVAPELGLVYSAQRAAGALIFEEAGVAQHERPNPQGRAVGIVLSLTTGH